ncbi:hypothetical protein BUE80_DR009982 [Diplocarpon rosae]|nr:hypothetical protein BUE80_DR009982 [Diplocarpon rosae]
MASTTTTPLARRSSSPLVGRLASSSPDPQIEILFTLPSVRIISFTTTSSKVSSRPGSSNGASIVEDEPGTLSWVSRFERTIAVGPLRIYRAPGSVAFLNCANALRPILPKSQAWCVDGNSKFVLQIRPPQYWRIEVPNATGDEHRMIEELKRVLEQVLRYEKTACPFQRDFVVKLPEKPQTPVKKRPWRPVARTGSEESPTSSPSSQATTSKNNPSQVLISEARPFTPCPSPRFSAPVRRSSSPPTPLQDAQYSEEKSDRNLRSAIKEVGFSSTHTNHAGESTEPRDLLNDPVPSRAFKPSLLRSPETEYVFSSYADEESDSYSDATDNTNLIPRSSAKAQREPPENDAGEHCRAQSMQNFSRSITAPPLLSLVASPPSNPRNHSPLRCSTSFETSTDYSSSVESFDSTDSWHSPLAPPSPPASATSLPTTAYPYPHENIVLSKRLVHSSDTSELTATLETRRGWDTNPASSTRSTPRSLSPPPSSPPSLSRDGSEKSDEEPFEIATPPTIKPSIRHRATTGSNSRRRALSPLPAAVNLFSPPRRRQRHLRTSRHLPTAIIQKTCEILLSPPSHLFSLMISIASKIAAGEWRGVLPGHREAAHWDFEDEYGSNSSYEDDYGVSLAKAAPASQTTSGTNVPGGSWEVD